MHLDDFLSPQKLPPAIAPVAAALPVVTSLPTGQQPAARPPLTPCQSHIPPADLFGDGSPSVCGCRHFWRDAYGNIHCGACQPPANRSLVRGYVWVAPDGQNVAIPAGGRGDAAVDGVGGRLAGLSGGPGSAGPTEPPNAGLDGRSLPPSAPLFIGDRRAKLRLICQQQPGELYEDWWERAAEADAFMWEVIALKEAGKLPGQQKQGPPAKMPKPPAGKELFYLVAVGGGKDAGNGDEESSPAGSLRIVTGKKANNFKRRLAITWEGADRWWPVPVTEEQPKSAVKSAVKTETRLASSST
jgi:hypothetical protein